MFLESTPYITIRNRNGLKTIDYTSADILGLGEPGPAAARSYNTIIGIYTTDDDGRKVYLETSGVYSTTTAAKHKPRAASLAIDNGFKVVTGIRPDVLHDLYFYAGENQALIIREILQEVETRRQLLGQLRNNINSSFLITDLLVSDKITSRRPPESKQYKNGNRLVKYYYQTNFKYIANIQYEVNQKSIPYTVQTRTGTARTNKYKYDVVTIREC